MRGAGSLVTVVCSFFSCEDGKDFMFLCFKKLFSTLSNFEMTCNMIIRKIKQRNAMVLLPPTNLNLCMIGSISLFEHFFLFLLVVGTPILCINDH